MPKRIKAPFEELVIEGTLVSSELAISSSELGELTVAGSLASTELKIESGFEIPLPTFVYLISRTTDERLISRVGDYPLTSRRL